jgi:hypothetical protein
MAESKSEKLQPEFSLPFGPRLKRMALIGLARAIADQTPPQLRSARLKAEKEAERSSKEEAPPKTSENR